MTAKGEANIELALDAWDQFERAVDMVVELSRSISQRKLHDGHANMHIDAMAALVSRFKLDYSYLATLEREGRNMNEMLRSIMALPSGIPTEGA